MERFGIQRPLSKNKCFLILSLLPVYFIAVGLAIQPVDEIFRGIVEIIREPDFLITDYFVIGGVGASFVNAGVLTLICIGIMYALDMNFDGHTITSTCLMFGFSLFGKNLLNIWMILVGVFLYARYHRTTVKRYLYVGFYGTSLSPIVSQVMHIMDLPLPLRFLLCAATGIVIGFVLPPLSTHVHFSHKGYSLYNVGFAGGIIATVIVSVLKSFGFTIEARLIWFTGQNQTFVILLSVLFGAMILYGILTDPMALEDYRSILRSYGLGGTDYYKSEGGAAVMINMGVNGLAAMLFVIMVGGDLNGPIIGGIFTVVGFSATGKHLRNILPVMAGVLIASEAKSWSITDPSALLALLLSTTLAPIAGEFGILAGVIAGFLHSSVALNVGIVYGGMNLYNNGFAGGLVAMFLVPVIQSIRDRSARARGGLSL